MNVHPIRGTPKGRGHGLPGTPEPGAQSPGTPGDPQLTRRGGLSALTQADLLHLASLRRAMYREGSSLGSVTPAGLNRAQVPELWAETPGSDSSVPSGFFDQEESHPSEVRLLPPVPDVLGPPASPVPRPRRQPPLPLPRQPRTHFLPPWMCLSWTFHVRAVTHRVTCVSGFSYLTF